MIEAVLMSAPANEALIRARVAAAVGVPPESLRLDALPAHASTRRYVRVGYGRRDSVIVMVLPPDALASDEATDGARPETLPFLEVGAYLDGLGVRVPRLLADHVDEGLVVLEDLGAQTLEDAFIAGGRSDKVRHELYGRAIDTLAFMRRRAEERPDLGGLAFSRGFDEALLRWELDHFREWGLEAGAGATLSDEEAAALAGHFDALAATLAALPTGLTHRDYQSRNLMVVEGGELAVIDFQDALQGPQVYDLVALLRDSYIALPRPFIEEMLGRYLDGYRALGGHPPEFEDFVEAFDLQTVQRKLKDAGRFVFIDQVKGNPGFLPYIAPSLGYVREALERLPQLAPLHALLGRHVPELA